MNDLLEPGDEPEIDADIYTPADMDGDGIAESIYFAADTDHDGFIDTEGLISDLDGDGVADFMSAVSDTDGDGQVDSGLLVAESDDPSVPDVFATFDSSGIIWGDVDASDMHTPGDLEPMLGGLADYNQVNGTPVADMAIWEEQDEPYSCAVATTTMLFRTEGIEIEEDVVASVFESRGIYDPNIGTNPGQIDEVINEMAITGGYDFHAEQIDGFTPETLQQMLDDGVRPLVAVDSAELYDDGSRLLNNLGLIPGAGHAVQVTGMISNEDGEFVVINDPGMPEGAGQMIPLDRFMDASEDFGNTAVALLDGPPDIERENHLRWGYKATAGVGLASIMMLQAATAKPEPNNTKPKS